MTVTELKRSILRRNDIDIVQNIKKLNFAFGFTKTLYVNSAGDDSDGESEETAYTSITTALDWIASNQSSGECHLIVVGIGSFDVNTTGDPTYDENIIILGSGPEKTIITNSHASATSVLKLTGYSAIYNLSITTGATSINGLLVGGSTADGFCCSSVVFDGSLATGALSLLYLDDSLYHINVKNCVFKSEATNVTAIHLNDCSYGTFSDIWIWRALIGIHLDHADDDYNIFSNIILDDNATGIKIDNAGSAMDYFNKIYFFSCTTNINDASTTSYYNDIYLNDSNVKIDVHPDDLTGTTVTAGVGANTFAAADTEIRSVAAATKPFYVLGFDYEVATSEKWGVRFITSTGTDYFHQCVVEGVANQLKNYMFENPILVRQGESVSCSVKSETGGNNTQIWLRIKPI